mmetsp:Transcript_54155/g.86104  ORF Transcript_54155/g.86104 Transcript_54155/m.86104 type:complete len:175 (+) Transcript_54155:87-611(+)
MVHGLLEAFGSIIHHPLSFVDLAPSHLANAKHPGLFHGRSSLEPQQAEQAPHDLSQIVGRAREAMQKVREMLDQRHKMLDAQKHLEAALQESKTSTEAVASQASKALGWPVEANLREASISPGAAFLVLSLRDSAERLQKPKMDVSVISQVSGSQRREKHVASSKHAQWRAFLS